MNGIARILSATSLAIGLLCSVSEVARAESQACKDIFKESRLQLETRISVLQNEERLRVHLEDARGFQFIKRIKDAGSVTLAVGNHTQFNRRQNLELYAQLARSIAESGRYVLYDADASTAEVIRQAAGARAIGISAKASNSDPNARIVKLHNMNMRMDAFGEKTTVISSTDSMVGVGLTLHSKTKWLIDVRGQWRQQLAAMTGRLNAEGRNLGTKFKEVPVLKDVADLNLSPIPMAQVEERDATDDELKEIAEHASAMKSVIEAGGIKSGAVVFGSAQVDPNSAELVYSVSRALGALGVNGTTGGAGGAMWLANAGFWDAGADSVGAPIVGRNQLSAETRVHSEVQTATAAVPNYHIRVYGLLTDKSIVVNVPGGGGTMREIAATLVKAASDPSQGPIVAFVDPRYYRDLTDLLLQLPLPRAFKNRLVVSLTPENAHEVARRAGALPRDGSRPTPRREQTTFELDRFRDVGP